MLLLLRLAITTVASLWCCVTVFMSYTYLARLVPIRRHEKDNQQRSMATSALNEFMRLEIQQKWHTNHMKVVPISGTMFSSLRGGLMCDIDMDVVVYDQSTIHMDVGQWNTELVEFVTDQFTKFGLIRDVNGIFYRAFDINMAALIAYTRTMLPSSSPIHKFRFDPDLDFTVDFVFPFTYIETDSYNNNKTFIRAGNTDIYSEPTFIHVPSEWWMDTNCKCYWPHTSFDCPCDERHAISILNEWERRPVLNNNKNSPQVIQKQQRPKPASEYEDTCLWIHIESGLEEESAKNIHRQINKAHSQGFVTFKSLMDITLDTDNWNRTVDHFTQKKYNWPVDDMLQKQVMNCQPAADLLLVAGVPCD